MNADSTRGRVKRLRREFFQLENNASTSCSNQSRCSRKSEWGKQRWGWRRPDRHRIEPRLLSSRTRGGGREKEGVLSRGRALTHNQHNKEGKGNRTGRKKNPERAKKKAQLFRGRSASLRGKDKKQKPLQDWGSSSKVKRKKGTPRKFGFAKIPLHRKNGPRWAATDQNMAKMGFPKTRRSKKTRGINQRGKKV